MSEMVQERDLFTMDNYMGNYGMTYA